MTDMQIEILEEGRLVRLEGEIDLLNADGLRTALKDVAKGADVSIDCTQLRYIDSTGIGVLVSSLKSVRESGGSVRIFGLQPHIAKIFMLTNLDKLFKVEEA